MSLSHLLQFRYERPCSDSGHTPSGNYGPRRKSQLRARPKESFLQTNFKFVLSPTAPPAHPAIYDADCIIDWCVRMRACARVNSKKSRPDLPAAPPGLPNHPHTSNPLHPTVPIPTK